MIKIRIDASDRKLEDVTETFIVEQVKRRRKDGISVSIQIIFKDEDVIVALVTPMYPARGRPIRKPTGRQKKVLDFWRKCNLDKENFQYDDLIYFLRKIGGYVD